jgi:hypothetical protein
MTEAEKLGIKKSELIEMIESYKEEKNESGNRN